MSSFKLELVEVQRANGDALDCFGVENVLLFQHAGSQCVRRITWKHRDVRLRNDGAVIVLLIH